ncbi:hypothetical protein [Hwangdonia lutea]|uniref:Uncharacterized protein n=1 Tax=Hwangdonia lutea TaxID=3075823 RepID=A0AA97EPL3_9FLAO|nr:hypothetical protein [Hwangdonia sp. SCSIO 19198]WOD44210.1 hypothetical protein RNZ46_02855 [Hwangdonia sp. SCSIO 19198]
MQCEDSDDVVDLDCDFTVIIDKEKYDNLHTESFKLSNAEIAGNCLTVTVSASGCDGNTWEYQLVDIH